MHSESDQALATRIAFLEKHVAEQDSEIYLLAKRVDTLVKIAKEHKAQLASVAELSSRSADDMPADEKPPHY